MKQGDWELLLIVQYTIPMLDNRRIFGLRRNVFFLGLVSLFNDFSAEMVYSVMPAFLTTVLGAPPIFLGFMEGFVDATASVLKIFSGWLSDKLGRRKNLAVLGYALSVSTRSVLGFVINLPQVFGLRVVDRIGKGFRDSPRDALLSESVESHELGKSFGYHRAMDTTGAILGPLGAVILLPLLHDNYRQLFFIAFGLGLLAIFSFLFVREIKTREEIRPKNPLAFTFSLRNFSHSFRLFLIALFAFGLGVMPVSLMLLKSQDVGLPVTAIPAMYLVYTIAFAIFAIPFGHVSDAVGEKKVMVGGFCAGIFAYLVLGFSTSVVGVAVGFMLFGLYSAMTDGVARAFASKLVSREQLAQGQGFLQSAVGISALLGGLVGGGIWTAYGATYAFIYGAIMMAIGLLVFVRLNGLHHLESN